MKRYKILHETDYNFSAVVQLQPHTLQLRPREGHKLRIESSTLDISPPATLRWHRDVFNLANPDPPRPGQKCLFLMRARRALIQPLAILSGPDILR